MKITIHAALAIVATLPALMGSEWADNCFPGEAELIVEGTVFEIPGWQCQQLEADSDGTCIEGGAFRCGARAAVSLATPGAPPHDLPLHASIDVTAEHATVVRSCDVAPGSHHITICPEDPAPVECVVVVRDRATTTFAFRLNPAHSYVRLHVDRLEFEQLTSAEVEFVPNEDFAYKVDEHRRVQLCALPAASRAAATG